MSAIRTDISYEGTEQAADQMDALLNRLGDLVTAEERAALATDRFERALDEAGREARQTRNELADAARGNRLFENSARGVALRVTQAETKLAAFGGALGQLGGAMQGINPEMDLFGRGLQSVSAGMGVAASMPGPWGIALGSLTAVMGATTAAMGYLDEQAQALAEAQQAAAEATMNLLDALRQQREAAAIASGAATVDAIDAAVREALDVREVIDNSLREARAQLRRVEQERANMSGASSRAMLAADAAVQRQRAQVESLVESLRNAEAGYQRVLDAQTRAAQRELRLASEDDRLQQEEEAQFATPTRRRGGGRRREDPNVALAREVLADLDEQTVRAEVAEEERIAAIRAELELQRQLNEIKEFGANLDVEAANARKNALNEEWALVQQIREHNEEAERRASEKRLEDARKITGAIEGTLQAVTAAYIDAFGAAIEGQKTLEEAGLEATKATLKMIGEQMVAIGIREALEGAAQTVSNPPVAATKIPMGLALIGLGVGFGAAGAAIPAQPSAPAERPRGDQDRGGGDGAGNLTINYNQPVISSGTSAQLSRQLQRQIAQGRTFENRRAAA